MKSKELQCLWQYSVELTSLKKVDYDRDMSHPDTDKDLINISLEIPFKNENEVKFDGIDIASGSTPAKIGISENDDKVKAKKNKRKVKIFKNLLKGRSVENKENNCKIDLDKENKINCKKNLKRGKIIKKLFRRRADEKIETICKIESTEMIHSVGNNAEFQKHIDEYRTNVASCSSYFTFLDEPSHEIKEDFDTIDSSDKNTSEINNSTEKNGKLKKQKKN